MKECVISVESICGETEDFSVKVGGHQGLALNSYLLSVVMDKVTKDKQGEVPNIYDNMGDTCYLRTI